VLPNASSDSKLTYLSETDSLVGFGSRERPSNNVRRRQELIDHLPPLSLGPQTKRALPQTEVGWSWNGVNNRSARADD
jgi:hypothetical protein